MYRELLKILGNGDEKAGYQQYMATCKWEKTKSGEAEVDARELQNYYYGKTYECLSHWLMRLIKLAHHYPSDKASQARWTSEVLSILDQNIPLPQLLKFLGKDNYLFVVRVHGFRSGDEDGDLQWLSNSVGGPAKDSYEFSGGLINMLIRKTGLMPFEVDRTYLGGIQ
jgi:hypothetical protein